MKTSDKDIIERINFPRLKSKPLFLIELYQKILDFELSKIPEERESEKSLQWYKQKIAESESDLEFINMMEKLLK